MKLAALFLAAALVGCGATATRIDYLETDTFISSADPSEHATYPYLKVGKAMTGEERSIVKLPTGKRNADTHLEEALRDPSLVLFFPFFVLVDVMADLFSCQGKTLAPTLLTSAKLVFDVTGNSEGTLGGKMSLHLLSKPWWQTANWSRAHVFSSTGAWAQPGGDMEASALAASTQSTATTIEFDVTTYFKGLLATESVHYGLLLKSSASSMGAVTLASTQATSSLSRPRVVSVYNCITPTSLLLAEESEAQPFTYILGQPR